MAGAPKLPSNPPPIVEASDVVMPQDGLKNIENSIMEIGAKTELEMSAMDELDAELDEFAASDQEGVDEGGEAKMTGEELFNQLNESGDYFLIAKAPDKTLIDAYNFVYDTVEDLNSSGQSETIIGGARTVYLGMMEKIINQLEAAREHTLKMENNDPSGRIERILESESG